ncbi:hypothetical protein H4684_003830 [Desulfomicrobium macestii]|uniref:Uncharacterized protein n=1 Tax=Desulfomicrobium macestii TaxID=90731 RepID=A0ABR9H9H7_9BACT|nr:hypothetical protein [Desulfomicrobium macestii]
MSFPRRRESMTDYDYRLAHTFVIPVQAGIHDPFQ